MPSQSSPPARRVPGAEALELGRIAGFEPARRLKGDQYEGDAVAVLWVNIGLHLEYKAGDARFCRMMHRRGADCSCASSMKPTAAHCRIRTVVN
jgi:hypothetical protein